MRGIVRVERSSSVDTVISSDSSPAMNGKCVAQLCFAAKKMYGSDDCLHSTARGSVSFEADLLRSRESDRNREWRACRSFEDHQCLGRHMTTLLARQSQRL